MKNVSREINCLGYLMKAIDGVTRIKIIDGKSHIT